MRSHEVTGLMLALLCSSACEPRERNAAPRTPASVDMVIDTGFATAPESAWVAVDGPTLIAFYPVVSNDSLEADGDLAAELDNLSYHIGTAMDSLIAAGFAVHYRGGDTLWLRTSDGGARVIRAADSSSVGYIFADSTGRRTVLYGVRGYTDLIEYAHEFRRTGALVPR